MRCFNCEELGHTARHCEATHRAKGMVPRINHAAERSAMGRTQDGGPRTAAPRTLTTPGGDEGATAAAGEIVAVRVRIQEPLTPIIGDIMPHDGGTRFAFVPMMTSGRRGICSIRVRGPNGAIADVVAWVDTGAAATTISAALARRLGLDESGQQELALFGERQVQVRLTDGVQLEIATARAATSQVWIINEIANGIDVLLGWEVLDGLQLVPDPHQQLLRMPVQLMHTTVQCAPLPRHRPTGAPGQMRVLTYVSWADRDAGVERQLLDRKEGSPWEEWGAEEGLPPMGPALLQALDPTTDARRLNELIAEGRTAQAGGEERHKEWIGQLRLNGLNQRRVAAFQVTGDDGMADEQDDILSDADMDWAQSALPPTLTDEEFAKSVEEQVAALPQGPCRERLRVVIYMYRHLFTEPLANAAAKVEAMTIDLQEGATPQRQWNYQKTAAQKEEMEKQVKSMLQMQVIRRVENARWNNPVILARKKDGTWRFCVDMRRLNKATRTKLRDMTLVCDILDQVSGKAWYSCLDFRSGYWQIALDTESQEMTAFTVGSGQYCFLRAPFGLKNCPVDFADRVQLITEGLPHVYPFFDDLTIATDGTLDQHIDALEACLERLSKYEVRLNIKKLQLCRSQAVILGHLVDKTGVRPDPAKVEAINAYPAPCTLKQLQRFLGMANFYSWLYECAALVLKPLTDMTRQKVEWRWVVEHQTAFETAKSRIAQATAVRRPDFTRPFIVCTDASIDGLAGVLAQKDDEGHEYPVRFVSRKCTPAERNYSATHLECGAVVMAMRAFAPYLKQASGITVITDHQALKALMSEPFPTGRLARWILFLTQFNFTVEHRPGKANVVPDAPHVPSHGRRQRARQKR